MRLPRLRFRLRTLLILIALAAIVLGTFVWMDRRASDFRRLAMDYRDMAKLDEIQSAISGERRYAVIAAYRRAHPKEIRVRRRPPLAPRRTRPATDAASRLIATYRRAASSESE